MALLRASSPKSLSSMGPMRAVSGCSTAWSADGRWSFGGSEAETTAGSSGNTSPMSAMTPQRLVTPRTPDLFTTRSVLSDVSVAEKLMYTRSPTLNRQPSPGGVDRHNQAATPKSKRSIDLRHLAAPDRTPVQRYVVRIGLRLQYRIPKLLEWAACLESHGISSRGSFENLSDDLARSIGVPRHLAEAMRADCAENSRRNDRVQPGLLERQDHAACQVDFSPRATHRADRAGSPALVIFSTHAMYDSNSGAPRDFSPNGGFPTALRDYEPKSPASPRRELSPLRTPVSASEDPAFQQHITRQSSARETRRNGFEMRISNVRHEDAPCRGEQALQHRSPGPVLGTSRDRALAGAALWTRMKEVTSDISPTYIPGPTAPEYRRDYGWGSPLSSPRTQSRLQSSSAALLPCLPEVKVSTRQNPRA